MQGCVLLQRYVREEKERPILLHKARYTINTHTPPIDTLVDHIIPTSHARMQLV